jgi:DNA-directed RNA polymerase sigma subunit (sigma70/sigma32)
LRQQWEETRTRSLDGADHLESEDSHVQRLEKASLQAAELQEQASAEDPQLAMLPALMGVLDELEERLIRNLYLRRPPFTPYQLRKSMGQMSEESLKQMEAEALRKLRAAAQEFQRHSSR